MITIFENEDFILKSTGHDYDFVGIIETKTSEPLTFFFSEELVPHNIEDEDDWDSYDWDDNIDEDETKLLDVYEGLKPYDENDDPIFGDDEEEEVGLSIGANSWFRTRDDGSTGFLSDPKERGWFLALIKNYCPERLKDISWA